LAKKPAIIIYDTTAKTTRRVLECDKSVTEEDYEINAQRRRNFYRRNPHQPRRYLVRSKASPRTLPKDYDWILHTVTSGRPTTCIQILTVDLQVCRSAGSSMRQEGSAVPWSCRIIIKI
jgi:hypothetical protein